MTLLPQDYYPSVSIVAGPVEHIPAHSGPMLRMHDGSIYVIISPDVARQWVTVLSSIATKEEEA